MTNPTSAALLNYTDEELLNNCPPVDIPPPSIASHLSEDAGGARLLISKIVCENFKSYGGRRTLGPFHKNFTCIIGPNGSGKSNVIDALLFVFGFRASKVRSKKLSSLIHNSDKLSNVEFCRVAVHFIRIVDTGTGANDYEVVPDSEFVVSRKAFQDSSNSYYVNDCKASFREVTGLLRQHGIDLDHNRFLILQGEVEQISLMKPKGSSEHEAGFLEYLEDIIGSNRFKEPLTILADRLERLKDIRLEKLARVKAVEKEKNELESVRDEAVAYLRLANKATRVKNVIFQQNQCRELKKETSLRQQLAEADAQLEMFVKKTKEVNSLLSGLKGRREELNRRATQLQEQHRDVKQRFSAFEAEDSRIRDEHAHLKSEGKKTVKTLQLERKRLDEVRRLPVEAEERRNALQKQLEELEQNKSKQEALYKDTMQILADETAPLRAKLEAAEVALAPVQKSTDEAASRLAIARQELELALSAFHREEERVSQARSGAQSAQDRLKEREKQLNEASRLLSDSSVGGGSGRKRQSSSSGGSLQDALARSSAELTECKKSEAQLIEEVNRFRTSIAEVKASFQADNSRNRVLTALKKGMHEGKLAGILGRLGDLGAIPAKYDVAVSTACGALDHIVVETMEKAQAAVEFLKHHNLGQASFIGLDKMTRWANEAKKPHVGPVASAIRLYDLIETSSVEIKPCFYFALRNTLVADSLDIATDWAFNHRQRFRVVTLQGQLIETSGAMSGGGGRPLSGRIATDLQKARRISSGYKDAVVTESSLAEKERELATKEASLKTLRQRRETLDDTIAQLTRQINETKRTVAKCQAEIVRLREEAEALTREAEFAEKRAANAGPSKEAREKMEASVTSLEKLHIEKLKKAESLRTKVETVKTSLVDAGSARLASARSRINMVEKKMKEITSQFTKLEVDIKSAHRNETRTQAKVESLEEEVASLKERLTSVEEKMVEIETTAKACMSEFNTVQKSIAELNEELEVVNGEIETSETSLAAHNKEEGSQKRKVEELRVATKDTAARARAWAAKLRTLRLHVIEDDENEQDEEQLSQANIDADVDAMETSRSVVIQTDLDAISKSRSTKLQVYTEQQLEEMEINEHELKRLEEKVSLMAPNMAAIEQYRIKVDIYLKRVADLEHVTELRSEQMKQEADAKSKRLTEFMAGFNIITTRLKEMYQMLTQGGDAELELIDSLDPFSEGIVFSVRPPKKTWKSIANLSGGEKTLSSLALVFALHHYKPTPLYVMDEIDAALDFKNVSIVGNYVMERTKNAQFIIISLRNNMYELADRLVGIYKTHNITKSVPLDSAYLSAKLTQAINRRRGVLTSFPDLNKNNNNRVLPLLPPTSVANPPAHLGDQPLPIVGFETSTTTATTTDLTMEFVVVEEEDEERENAEGDGQSSCGTSSVQTFAPTTDADSDAIELD